MRPNRVLNLGGCTFWGGGCTIAIPYFGPPSVGFPKLVVPFWASPQWWIYVLGFTLRSPIYGNYQVSANAFLWLLLLLLAAGLLAAAQYVCLVSVVTNCGLGVLVAVVVAVAVIVNSCRGCSSSPRRGSRGSSNNYPDITIQSHNSNSNNCKIQRQHSSKLTWMIIRGNWW